MARHNPPLHQLGVGTRLGEAPSAALIASFAHELRYAGGLYDGLSYADVAHTIMLLETGIVPLAPGVRLLAALVALHDGGLAALPLDPKWGDVYNNRDAELQRRVGRDAGWLHAGRARREALTVGWLIQVRALARDLARAALAAARTMADVAALHASTLMPDFTYLQHAQPTTLGHFVLGFAYPLLRDAERLCRELPIINACPAGSASTNGSRLPLDRRRVCELLGFDELTIHNRDAMWRSDVPINLMSLVVSLATTADRLAEDLQIWATDEFDFVALADRHCRTSVIMPNKKNPYALSFIRGQARSLTGPLVSIVGTNQTPSGQLDNRNAAYEQLPAALETARAVLALLDEVLAAARFNQTRMRAQAETGFTYATELADLLMQREQIDARTAHEVVGAVVSAQQTAGAAAVAGDLTRCFEAITGRAMRVPVAAVLAELTAERIVGNRVGEGSCAPAAVRQMADDVRAAGDRLAAQLDGAEAAARFPALLRRCVSERLGKAW